MHIEPELGGASLVLLGNFNPSIFSPMWFFHYGLATESEFNSAEVEVIHPEIARFKIGTKTVHVEEMRFSVDTQEAPWVSIADLVLRIFGEFLPHTPVRQVGINRMVHFSVGSEDTRNKIGRVIAPPSAWGAWGLSIENSPKELRSGFTSMTMQYTWKKENYAGRTQATIQPSTAMNNNSGIYMTINDHCDIVANGQLVGSDRAVSYISDNFETSIRNSEWVIDQIMQLKDRV